MNQVQKIREYVRNIARKIKSEQKMHLKEEVKLRKYVRKLLREIEEISPHDSTGINVLEDLLKTIVPILQSNYKRLTSDLEQRESFRAHIITSVQNLLATESIYFSAGKKSANAPGQEEDLQEQGEEEQNISDDSVPDDPAFIDINKDKKIKQSKEKEPKPEDAFVSLEDEDSTGRGFALQAFNKIQKQILEAYSLLGKEEDREVFYDYLITNLKLYFDLFENDLKKHIKNEPTTDAYEKEKQRINSYSGGGESSGDTEIDAGEVEGAEEMT